MIVDKARIEDLKKKAQYCIDRAESELNDLQLDLCDSFADMVPFGPIRVSRVEIRRLEALYAALVRAEAETDGGKPQQPDTVCDEVPSNAAPTE